MRAVRRKGPLGVTSSAAGKPIRRVTALLSVGLLALLLSSCVPSGETQADLVDERTTSSSDTGSTPTTPVLINDIAPQDQPPPLEPAHDQAFPSDSVRTTPTSTVRGTPTETADRNPEQRNTAVVSGELPAGFTLPDGASLFAPASKLDGDNSVLTFRSERAWGDTVDALRGELEADGWVCASCLPFTAGPGTAAKGTTRWLYILEMTRDDRSLIAVISETDRASQVDINFNARR